MARCKELIKKYNLYHSLNPNSGIGEQEVDFTIISEALNTEFIKSTLKNDWGKPKQSILQIQDHICFAHCHEINRESYNTYQTLKNLTVEEIMYSIGLEELLTTTFDSPSDLSDIVSRSANSNNNAKGNNAAYYLIKIFLILRNFRRR